MRATILSAALAGLMLSSPAFAQENPEDLLPPPPKRNEVGDWRPNEAPPNLDATPPAATPAPMAPGEAAAPPAPERTEEEERQRQAQIEKNRQAAIDTLVGVSNDKTQDYKVQVTRKTNLEALVKRYEGELDTALGRRRQLQVELFQRTLQIKQQHDAGKLPDDVFEKRMKEENDQYLRERNALDGDIKFYEEELARLRPKLQEQASKVDLIKTTSPEVVEAMQPKKEPSVASQLVQQLDRTTRELSAFKIKGSLGGQRLDGHP